MNYNKGYLRETRINSLDLQPFLSLESVKLIEVSNNRTKLV